MRDRLPINRENLLATPQPWVLGEPPRHHVGDGQGWGVPQDHAEGATRPPRGTGRICFDGPESRARQKMRVTVASAGEELFKRRGGQVVETKVPVSLRLQSRKAF